jgi:surface polysaccharide O-acyltransferase-like enzyme
MKSLTQRSEWIDSAKLFAIFAVVILHSAASVLTHSEFNTYDWWIANMIDASVRWAVPVFVMITGILLINGSTEYISNFKKISFRLLLPFGCWLVVYFCWNYIKYYMKGELGSFDYFGDVLHGVPHYHL